VNSGRRGVIRVLAGTNGAGKSSVGGVHFRESGANYFNPDEVARDLLASGAVASLDEANSHAWKRGVAELRRAIDAHTDFSFETTLGGNTVPGLLANASDRGLQVHIWYFGLESPELHIDRVRARVAAGGHAIPEEKIRSRYNRSRENLIRLLPKLASLHLFDNSAPPDRIEMVEPRLLIRLESGRILEVAIDADIPQWARDIIAAARGGE
jgi:predicted ABC-type ATPase